MYIVCACMCVCVCVCGGGGGGGAGGAAVYVNHHRSYTKNTHEPFTYNFKSYYLGLYILYINLRLTNAFSSSVVFFVPVVKDPGEG